LLIVSRGIMTAVYHRSVFVCQRSVLISSRCIMAAVCQRFVLIISRGNMAALCQRFV